MPDILPTELLRDFWSAAALVTDDSERSRIRKRIGQVKDAAAGWQTPGQCYFPTCRAKSIQNSHTVQRASLTQNLSKFVYTPVWTRGGFEVTLKSPTELSTFPGYCKPHEAAFKFERAGHFSGWRDDVLQIMRTTHRELWLTRKRIELLGKLQDLCGDVLPALPGAGSAGTSVTMRLQRMSEVIPEFTLRQREMLTRVRAMANVLESTVRRDARPTSDLVRAQDLAAVQPYAFHSAVTLSHPSAPLLAIALVFNGASSRLITAIEPSFENFHAPYWTQFLSSDAKAELTLLEWVEAGTLDWYASVDWWEAKTEAERGLLTEKLNALPFST